MTNKRQTRTQKERAEIYQTVEDLMTGERKATDAERKTIQKLQRELGFELGLLRFVLDECDKAEDDAG